MKKLHIGCGGDKREDSIGVDLQSLSCVDVIANLENFPWPFKDDTFQTVYAIHVLEHLKDIVGVMDEIHRVSKPGASLNIITPHYSSSYSWNDPTHVHHFGTDSFNFFTKDSQHTYTDKLYEMKNFELDFSSSIFARIGEFLYWMNPRRYEKRFTFMFPAGEMKIEMTVKK